MLLLDPCCLYIQKSGARYFGGLLYDALMIEFNQGAGRGGATPAACDKKLSPRVAGSVVASFYTSKEKSM